MYLNSNGARKRVGVGVILFYADFFFVYLRVLNDDGDGNFNGVCVGLHCKRRQNIEYKYIYTAIYKENENLYIVFISNGSFFNFTEYERTLAVYDIEYHGVSLA